MELGIYETQLIGLRSDKRKKFFIQDFFQVTIQSHQFAIDLRKKKRNAEVQKKREYCKTRELENGNFHSTYSFSEDYRDKANRNAIKTELKSANSSEKVEKIMKKIFRIVEEIGIEWVMNDKEFEEILFSKVSNADEQSAVIFFQIINSSGLGSFDAITYFLSKGILDYIEKFTNFSSSLNSSLLSEITKTLSFISEHSSSLSPAFKKPMIQIVLNILKNSQIKSLSPLINSLNAILYCDSQMINYFIDYYGFLVIIESQSTLLIDLLSLIFTLTTGNKYSIKYLIKQNILEMFSLTTFNPDANELLWILKALANISVSRSKSNFFIVNGPIFERIQSSLMDESEEIRNEASAIIRNFSVKSDRNDKLKAISRGVLQNISQGLLRYFGPFYVNNLLVACYHFLITVNESHEEINTHEKYVLIDSLNKYIVSASDDISERALFLLENLSGDVGYNS